MYVSLLGVKYILFMGRGDFEGWIPAGLFMGQLRTRDTYSYARLKNEIIGIRGEKAFPKSTASEVLSKMQDARTDYIPIVSENNIYLYMVSKQDLLARLVSTMILNESK